VRACPPQGNVIHCGLKTLYQTTMLKPLDIANYFLSLGKCKDLTNLKLQKMVYYAYGHYIAHYNQPLFHARIEAWDFGPVIPELYSKLKKYKDQVVASPKEFDKSVLRGKTKFLDQIHDIYGAYSGSKLCTLTHAKSSPWDIVFHKKDTNTLLNNHLLKAYFTAVIESTDSNSDQFDITESLSKDSGLTETMYILSNPKNAEKLMKAMEESAGGDTSTLDWRNVN
jgi:uncharacterized phage-associated protein